MDILYLLKTEQEAVFQSLKKMQELGESPKEFKQWFPTLKFLISRYMKIDQDFLYLEVSDTLPNVAKFVEVGRVGHKKISGQLALIANLLGQDQGIVSPGELPSALALLCEQVTAHIRYQQEHIIPKMRELIPTQDREDLSDILQDLTAEWDQESSGSNPGMTNSVLAAGNFA